MKFEQLLKNIKYLIFKYDIFELLYKKIILKKAARGGGGKNKILQNIH
jgi:hypothetical protein